VTMDFQALNAQIEELSQQVGDLLAISEMSKLRLEYEQWYSQVKYIVSTYLPSRLTELDKYYTVISRYLIEHPSSPGVTSRRYFHTALQQQQGILSSIPHIQQLRKDNVELQTYSHEPYCLVERVCSRFHLVAKQLLSRHEDRPTLTINDEYDVQDLLHALLRLYFDDVRPEEWTPSYAGRSSRVDFLLKNESIVIEVKKTRRGLTEKEIGDQLIVDIGRYQKHPSCRTLVCFVYDPEGRIQNPQGLGSDLERADEDFTVKVLIAPKRY